MKKSEYTSMRLAFEKAHSLLEDKRLLGQSILDAIEAGLEEGEHRAPRLVELPSRHETTIAMQGKTDSVGGQDQPANQSQVEPALGRMRVPRQDPHPLGRL